MDILKKIATLPSDIINTYYDIYTGGRNREIFFDIDETMPELRLIDDHYEDIKEELNNIQKYYRIPDYEEVDKFQYDASRPASKWKIFILYMMGEYPKMAEDLCPKTCALLKELPNVFQVIFSILEPGRSVPAHKGPYKGYIRYHLGIKVPTENAPKIRIKDQFYTWKENESVLFDDSWDHEVYNEATEERVVLIIDIFRPMPKTPDRVNKFLTKYIIGPTYGKNAIKQYRKYFRKLDKPKQA